MNDRVCHFSPCRKYRYTLWREWPELVPNSSYLMVIGLNPSTADETKDDPTIRRCIGFAKRWGLGALCMTNLFAWRDTKPSGMKRAADPVGMDNKQHIVSCAANAGLILAAWGIHGSFRNQDFNVLEWVKSVGKELHCLRRNADGSPEHPLYIPSSITPEKFTMKEGA